MPEDYKYKYEYEHKYKSEYDNDIEVINAEHNWKPILPQQKLKADQEHVFENEIINTEKAVTHLKLKIYPDGGISRLRVLGTLK